MNANTDTVFIEALSLPFKERVSLVEKLLLSIEPEAGTPEMEALDRCRAFDSGQLTERSAVDVMNDAYHRLK